MPRETPRKRTCYVPAAALNNLNLACIVVEEAFESGGVGTYLVGSALERPDYRDVDVRVILRDAEFARLFGDCAALPQYSALWSMMCTGIGLWLSKQTGLPVDFQIQQMSAANAEYPHPSKNGARERYPLGVFKNPNPPDYSATAAADGVDP